MHLVILRKQLPPTRIYIGKDALHIPAGHIVLVKRNDNDCSPEEKILMRTSFDDTPFITLHTGNMWGTVIDSYIFEDLGKHLLSIVGK